MTQQPDSPEAEWPEAEEPEADRYAVPGAEEVVYKTGGLPLVLLMAVLAAIWLWAGLSTVVFILALVVMIFLHELGHFVTARWTGMKATEFFIGFGPRIWSFRRGETEYGLKVIPAGAYVRIIGMNNLEDVPPEDEPKAYRNKSFPRKLLVVCAGSLMHFILAFLVAVVLLVGFGRPGGAIIPDDRVDRSWVVRDITPGSAAEDAGLQLGDKVVAWNGEPIATWADVQDAVDGASVGERVTLTAARDGEQFERTTELVDRASVTGEDVRVGQPFLGIGPEYPAEQMGLVEGVERAATETGRTMGVVVDGIRYLFSPAGLSNFFEQVSQGGDSAQEPRQQGEPSGEVQEGSSNEGRPMSILGVVVMGGQAGEQGLEPMLFLFFVVNIFVGMFNMIPLVPFDGGHAAVAIYERLRSRGGNVYRVDYAKLMPVAYAVVMALIMLFTGALYLDIVSPVEL